MAEIERMVVNGKVMNFLRRQWIKEGRYFLKSPHASYVPSLRAKFLLEKVVRDWPDEDGVLVPMTPGEAARTELVREFPGHKKVGWRGPSVKLFDWKWPMYFRQPFDGFGLYVDLVAAYWQIYQKIWLDISFPGGSGAKDLEPVAKRLELWKQARNSVIGICASRSIAAVKEGKTIHIANQNKFLSPHLWASVQATLNELAELAWSHGAIYCMTDGYIFPTEAQGEEFMIALDLLGVNYRHKWANLQVKGWLSYSIPGVKTTYFYKQNIDGGRTFKMVRLARKFKPLALTEHIFWRCPKIKQLRERSK